MSEDVALDKVQDPSTSALDLAQIAGERPDLHAAVAAHPNAYPELLTWLRAQGNPAVVAVVEARTLRSQPAVPPAPPLPTTPDQGQPIQQPQQYPSHPGAQQYPAPQQQYPWQPFGGQQQPPGSQPGASQQFPGQQQFPNQLYPVAAGVGQVAQPAASKKGLIIGLVAGGVALILIIVGALVVPGLVTKASFCENAKTLVSDTTGSNAFDTSTARTTARDLQKLADSAPSDGSKRALTVLAKAYSAYASSGDISDLAAASSISTDDLKALGADLSTCGVDVSSLNNR